MTAPVLENGPYIFNVNNLFSESSKNDKCKRQVLELKNGLVALGGANTIWTVVASCDSTEARNIGHGTPDIWSDISDIVRAANGQAHSWCVLKNLTTLAHLVIDYNDPTYYESVDVYYSADGSVQANGTTTNRPSITNGTVMLSNTKMQFYGFYGTTTKFVMNVMCSADKKTTRWYWHERSGSAVGGSVGLIEEVVNTPSIWTSTNKTAIFQDSTNIVRLDTISYGSSPSMQDFDNQTMMAFIDTDEPASYTVLAYPTVEGYNYLSGISNTLHPLFMNHVSQDIIGGYPVCPIGLFRPDGSMSGSLGRLRDIYAAQNTQYPLDTYPGDASRTWVKWGCLMVPWDGSIPQDAV